MSKRKVGATSFIDKNNISGIQNGQWRPINLIIKFFSTIEVLTVLSDGDVEYYG